MLQQFAVVENLDLGEAVDFVARPHEGQPAIPFGRIEPPTATQKRKLEEEPGPSRGNIWPRHKAGDMKYGGPNRFWERTGESDISRTLPEHLRLRSWIKALKNLEAAAISQATGAKYKSAVANLMEFGEDSGTSIIWPLSPELINAFIIWCHEKKNLTAGSIKTYLSGLRHVQRVMGFESPGPLATEKFLIQGVRNFSKIKSCPLPGPAPITFRLLRKFRKYTRGISDISEVGRVIWSAATVAFFSSCRIGDLLAKHEHSFDKFSDVLWGDISVLQDGTWKLHLKNSKVFNPGGEDLFLFEFPNRKMCPVRTLDSMKRKQIKWGIWDPRMPVFRSKSGENLTRKRFNSELKKFGDRIGAKISGKSFRAGIASALEKFPDVATDSHIKAWGGWKSKAFLRYMKSDPSQKKWFFENKITKILLSPQVPPGRIGGGT